MAPFITKSEHNDPMERAREGEDEQPRQRGVSLALHPRVRARAARARKIDAAAADRQRAAKFPQGFSMPPPPPLLTAANFERTNGTNQFTPLHGPYALHANDEGADDGEGGLRPKTNLDQMKTGNTE